MMAVARKKWWGQAALMVLLGLGCLLAPATAADEKKPAKDKKPAEVEKLPPVPRVGKDVSLPPAVTKNTPETVEDLKAFQEHVKKILKKVISCTVGVIIGPAAGSGVIISEDGYILTAGHVSGQPGRNVVILMHDGRRLKGKTLGQNQGIDSGMIKITDKGKYPFVPLGASKKVKAGQWVLATGHPRGYMVGRTPVLRVGRVSVATTNLIRTDCTLVGGDSGGPLFDMQGRVIGIHSRIGMSLADNMHVPVDTYRDTWDRLVKGEKWGGGWFDFSSRRTPAYLGIEADPDVPECKIIKVTPGSPAEKAGFKVGDVVTKFDGNKIGNFDDLGIAIRKKKVGDSVAVEVLRDKKPMTIKVVLGKRSS
jgi:serine protease Do